MYDWSELTPQKAAQIRNAICGAIGWISAGRNEGNNAVAGETVNNLATSRQSALQRSRPNDR